MTRNPANPKPRISELSLKQYQIRSHAKLCIGFIFFFQSILRLCTILPDPALKGKAKLFGEITLAFPFAICLTIATEYYLFRKLGLTMIKYSKVVDLLILSLFMADWIIIVISSLNSVLPTDPPTFKISAVNGFSSFSWRTLLVTLIAQRWQIRITPPVIVIGIVTGYAIYYDPSNWVFLLLKAGGQVFSLIVIIYCEDKMKWKIMWTNLRQEKWMEVNNFILNNIPENIMILSFKGEAKFVSDYCKDFMKKNNVSLENKDLFKKIQHLQQQQSEFNSGLNRANSNFLQMERLTTSNGLFDEPEDSSESSYKPKVLEDLVMNFAEIVKRKNLQERQFLAYDGKLKQEEEDDDKSIEVKISFVHNFDDDYIILILRDMTHRDLLATLEETNKYKDQLLASVSHELRAPLNGSMNLIESAVNSSEIPESIKETLLAPALQSSRVLLHIINDIIDMSQIKQNKLRPVFQSADLKETIKNTAKLVEIQAKKKGIEFQVELGNDLPDNFCTDHIRLSQVILNLLTNAVKFTAKGIVKLNALRLFESPWVKITIEDSGIGMTQENIKKLSKGGTCIGSDGRGLGLSISSHLVEMLGPKSHQNLNIQSVPNQGSIFSFILEDKENIPLEIPHQKEQDCESSDSFPVAEEFTKPILAPASSKIQTLATSNSLQLITVANSCLCPRVLIVDDNPFNIMALETVLNSLGVKSDSVYRGSAAIKKLLDRQNHPCGHECRQYTVVFMDQEMPEMSGADTVKEIRRLQKEKMISSNMKFIGCTAHKGKEEVERFFAAGLDDCIYKPVSIVMIKDILKRNIVHE